MWFGFPTQFTWRLPLALINLLINNAILTVKLFAAACYALAGFSIYYFTYRLTGKKVTATASSVIFMVNQFLIGKWANGFYHAGFAYALTPLLFIALDSALRTRKLKWILAFSLAYSALFLTRYDPLIYITPFLLLYTAFVLVKPYNGIKRILIIKVLFAIGVLTALFSSFVLIPVIFRVRPSGATIGMKLPIETIHSLDFLHALFGFSTELSYLTWTGRLSLRTHPFLPGLWYMFFMAIPAVLAFAALLFRRDRWTLFLASSALIAVFMAKGFGPPLGEVYEWLYFNVPFIGALHVPVRWLMITYFAYAFLAGVTVNAIYDGLRSFFNRYSGAFKRKVLGVLPSLVVVVILSSAVLPVSGIMAEGLQPWSPSSDLVDAYRWLADQPGDYRIVTVPYGQHRMWAYWEEQEILGQRIILDDHQTDFWVNKNPNYVSLRDSILVADELSRDYPKISRDSLWINIHTSDRPTLSIIEHEFSPIEDWNGYRYLIAWFKGENTGLDFSITIYFSFTIDNYVQFHFRDTSTGWRRIVFSMAYPDALAGVVNWGKVWRITLSASDKTTTGTFYLDRISIATELKLKGNEWPLQDIGTQSHFYHGKPVMSTGYGEGYPYSWDFVQYTNSLISQNGTTNLMKILGLGNIRYLLMQEYWPMVDPKENSYDFQHEFFLRQNGLKKIYRSGTNTVYENEFWVPHFSVTSKLAIVVGGREALRMIVDVGKIDVSQYVLIFADQVIRNCGVELFMELAREAELLIYVNSEPIDLAMLVLEDAIRIKASEFAYPSQKEDKYWVAKESFINNGMFVYNKFALTTSGSTQKRIPFEVKSEGTYDFWVRLLHGPDRGNLSVTVDGENMGTIVPYQRDQRFKWVNLGEVQLVQGNHVVALQNKRVGSFGIESAIDEFILVKPSVLNSTIDSVEKIWKGAIGKKEIESITFKNLEDGKIVVDSDQTGFWMNSNPSHVSLLYDQTVKADDQSNGSLRVNMHSSNRRTYSILEHQFSPMEDWNGYRYLVIWFKGENTGLGFSLGVYFDSSFDNHVLFHFRDTSTGWRRIVFSMAYPDALAGVVNWGKVWRITLSASDKTTTGTFYLDRIAMGRAITTEENGHFILKREVDRMLVYGLRMADDGSPEVMSYVRVNPTLYKVHVKSEKPFFLVFSECYHNMWRASVEGKQLVSIPAYSFMNSFYVTETGDVWITVEFSGQSSATIGVLISAFSLIVTLVFLVINKKEWLRLHNLNLLHKIQGARYSKDRLETQLLVSRPKND
ncbi:MAG: hypothetical protein ACE5OW_02230 [Candidatus Bathyarchaeia archaeon]